MNPSMCPRSRGVERLPSAWPRVHTETKLLVDLGLVCAKDQHETLKNLPCRRIECDETVVRRREG